MTSLAARVVLAVAISCVLAGCRRDPATWSGEGDLLAVEESGPWLTIEHDDIPDLPLARTARLLARSPDVARGVAPGMRVRFDLARDGDRLVVTRLERLGPARGPGQPEIEDQTAHHGGVVAMAGELHVEATATRDGVIRVWLNDEDRNAVPLAGASAQVRIDLGDQHPTLPLVERDGVLVANGPPLPGDDVRVHLALHREGGPVEVYFVLPLSGGRPGAGGVPEAGCVPVAPAADGSRVPRCTISFPHPVLAVAATADGQLAIVSDAEGAVSAWRMPAAEIALTFAPPPPEQVTVLEGAESEEGATSVAIRRDGTQAAIAIGDRIIEYRLDSGQVVRQLPDVPAKVRDLAWSPDGARLLATFLGDPDARLIDAETGEAVRRIPVAQEAAAIAFRGDGRLAAVGSEIGPIVVFDPGSTVPPRPLADVLQPVESVAFAGDRVVWAGADRSLRVWEGESGSPVALTSLPEAAVRLAVSPDGTIAAVVLRSGVIELRHLDDGSLLDTLRWHRSGVRAVAWAGSFLVSGDNGGAVAIWDLTGISGNH